MTQDHDAIIIAPSFKRAQNTQTNTFENLEQLEQDIQDISSFVLYPDSLSMHQKVSEIAFNLGEFLKEEDTDPKVLSVAKTLINTVLYDEDTARRMSFSCMTPHNTTPAYDLMRKMSIVSTNPTLNFDTLIDNLEPIIHPSEDISDSNVQTVDFKRRRATTPKEQIKELTRYALFNGEQINFFAELKLNEALTTKLILDFPIPNKDDQDAAATAIVEHIAQNGLTPTAIESTWKLYNSYMSLLPYLVTEDPAEQAEHQMCIMNTIVMNRAFLNAYLNLEQRDHDQRLLSAINVNCLQACLTDNPEESQIRTQYVEYDFNDFLTSSILDHTGQSYIQKGPAPKGS